MELQVLGVDPIDDYWELSPGALPFVAIVLPVGDQYRVAREHCRLSKAGDPVRDEFDPWLVWWRYAPQTGGLCCNHPGPYYVAPLVPSEIAKSGMAELEATWLNSNVGCPSTSFDDIVGYRQHIRNLFGADCQWSYPDLQEAVYPLDWDEDLIRRLSGLELPPFNELIVEWRAKHSERWMTFSYDPQPAFTLYKLIIFGNNSD